MELLSNLDGIFGVPRCPIGHNKDLPPPPLAYVF
jgi:hypothetical protein